MSKWSGFFPVVTPKGDATKVTDNQGTAGSAYSNYSWYHKTVRGSASRMVRYGQYDRMDVDVEVARALDTIAEEMTGNETRTDEPIEIDLLTDNPTEAHSTSVLTIQAALSRWNRIHNWENKLFPISRMVAKYGDVFFQRNKDNPSQPWTFIHPKNVTGAYRDRTDPNKIVAWQLNPESKQGKTSGFNSPVDTTTTETQVIPAEEMIHFTLNDDMSDFAPFGESVLRCVYQSHKQKELLEDAIIIYRVQRAPERRVFYIDVGTMPPQRVSNYLQTIKNEINQKKVPSISGGQSTFDSVYNPQSMSEDFFFASRPGGGGSRVDTLPGGAGLGELSDLEYFQKKVWRGLRIPTSYMMEADQGGASWNDGKVGMSYIQELRFALYIKRLQGHISNTMDAEFKKYLRSANIQIDESTYRLTLPAPSNFGQYKEQEISAQLLGTYGSADGIEYMSKRFIMKRYLQLSDKEIAINEQMLREERQMTSNGAADYPSLYGPSDGVGGLAGDLGGIDMEPTPGGLDGEPDAEGGATPPTGDTPTS